MAPQTRSAARRTSRSSTKSNASGPIEATTTRRKANSSKSNRNRKITSNSKGNPKSKPIRKRARSASIESETPLPVTTRKRAKPRAKFEVFMDMPVEVFIEVAKYLHPFDLILLSRVNKFFRDLFMSRRAAPIWREAQLNVDVHGLPLCPESISEPRYAAMLFTKMCSTCGRLAHREMDPILLVRLCEKCREEQAVDISLVTDPSLVFTSRDLVSGKKSDVAWCLYEDAKAVKAKLNELAAAGDKEAEEMWVQERRKEVDRRSRDALPLKQWLEDRDKAREAELEQIKGARQAEIESRLEKLGWERNDIDAHDYWRKEQWKSLTYNTKPLSDRAWRELLPSLLGHLKINREQRLEREISNRRYTRGRKLQDWLLAIQNQMEPLARAIASSEFSASTSTMGHWNIDEDKGDKMLLQQSFPAAYHAFTWPEFKALHDMDIPIEDFTVTLEGRSDILKNLIKEWRNRFEASIAKMLPEDTPAPDCNNVPDFTFTIGTSEHTQPISSLPVDLQKLLRADAIFQPEGYHRVRFYPDGFADIDLDPSYVAYHVEAAKVAKALLNVLNRPNALYLELKALGCAFQCGRCNAPPQYMSWTSIVHHYLDTASEWHQISQATQFHRAEFFTFTFTHDIDVISPDKPLVRIVGESHKVPYPSLNTRLCKLCQEVDIVHEYQGNYLIDHIRDVHLIEEPKPGEHYEID